MPRVPEGKFNKEISSRVGSPRIPDIASPSKHLKKLGAGFQKIGDTLAAAQKKADSLQEINTAEKSFDSEIQPQIDQIFQDAIDGKITSPDGNSLDMADAVKQSLDNYQTEALSKASSGTDAPGFAAHFERFMVPKMERLHQKAEKQQSRQKIAGVNSNMEEGANLIVQREIDGLSTPEDVASYMSQAEQSVSVVGANAAGGYVEALKLKRAAAQRQVISKQGATPQNIARANEAFAAVPEGQRRHLSRGFDTFIQDKVNADRIFAYKQDAEYSKQKMWPREMALSQNKTSQVLANQENNILAEGETGDMRQSSYANLVSHQMASQIFMSDFKLEMGSEATETAIDESMQVLLERLDKKHISTLDQTARPDGRSPVAMSDKFANKIEKAFRSEMSRLHALRKSDAQEWINQYNPSIAEDLYSGDPNRGAKAEADLAEFYTQAGIPHDKRRIVTAGHATTFGENYKSFESGGDPTGKAGDDLIKQLASSVPEDMADRAVNDMVEMGGIPSEFLFVQKSGDPAFRRFLSASSSKYDNNLASLITDGRLQEDINGNSKGAFRKKIGTLIQSEIPEISKLYPAGKEMHEGYINSIMMMAASKAAEGGKSLQEATLWATKRMKDTFRVAAKGTSSILMDKVYATKHTIPMDAVDNILKSVTDLKHLRNAGYPIDYEKMGILMKNNPRLAPAMKAFEAQSSNKKGIGKADDNFKDMLGDNIVVRPDKNQHNRLRLYIQDPQIGSNLIPLIKDTQEDYAGPETSKQYQTRLNNMEPISIPIHEYYNQKVSDEEARSFKNRQGSSPVGSFRQLGGS